MTDEGVTVVETGVAAEEAEPASVVQGDETGEEQAPEQLCEDTDREKEAGREDTQRSPSSEMPPPGTIMWTCGWWVSAEPQV